MPSPSLPHPPQPIVGLTTLYDIVPQHCRHRVSEHDLANLEGDLYFSLKDRYLPLACPQCASKPARCFTPALFDCFNPESSGALVVRRVSLEVLRIGRYAMCDAWRRRPPSCDYTCLSPPTGGVGAERICAAPPLPVRGECVMAPRPLPILSDSEWDYWNWNLAARLGDEGGAMWYSPRRAGEGSDWRNATVLKAVSERCHRRRVEAAITAAGAPCFASCPQPANRSSACWIRCFFDTVLGPDSGTRLTRRPAAAMPLDALRAAWLRGFEDPERGGCPPCPPDGPCDDGTEAEWQSPTTASVTAS